jgi:hypothetical protein
MHFCGGLDDLVYLLMFVPGLSFLFGWVRAKLHHKRKHKDCDHG